MKNKHAVALGRMGGLTTKKKGKAFFKKIGKLGGEMKRKNAPIDETKPQLNTNH